MEIKRRKPAFENRMTPLQRTLGWVYLPLHAAVIPLLLLVYGGTGAAVNEAYANLIYYALGLVFVLAVMLRFLRGQFDVLLDRLPGCILTLLWGMVLIYALNTAAGAVLLALQDTLQNPNDAAIAELAAENYGIIRGLGIFIAPVVEEVLFRGVLFGSLRTRSRGWAYVVSALVFSLYHVWQPAALSGDWSLLLYAVEYLPVSVVLAWCYERSGCLWTGIFFHMGFNALGFAVMDMLL